MPVNFIVYGSAFIVYLWAMLAYSNVLFLGAGALIVTLIFIAITLVVENKNLFSVLTKFFIFSAAVVLLNIAKDLYFFDHWHFNYLFFIITLVAVIYSKHVNFLNLLTFIFVLLLIQSIIGISQYAGIDLWVFKIIDIGPQYIDGITQHKIYDESGNLVSNVAVGLARHHLFFSELLITGLFTLFILSFNKWLDFKRVFIFRCILLFCVVALVFSFSRSSWIGVLLAASVFLFIRFRKLRILLTVIFLLGLLGISYSINQAKSNIFNHKLIALETGNNVIDRFISTFDLSGNRDRLYMWLAGTRSLGNNFLTGVGEEEVKRQYQIIEEEFGHKIYNPVDVGGLHNMYLEGLVRGGILRLFLVIILLLALPLYGVYNYLKYKDFIKHHLQQNTGYKDNLDLSIKLDALLGFSLSIIALAATALFENVLSGGSQRSALYFVLGLIFFLSRELKNKYHDIKNTTGAT